MYFRPRFKFSFVNETPEAVLKNKEGFDDLKKAVESVSNKAKELQDGLTIILINNNLYKYVEYVKVNLSNGTAPDFIAEVKWKNK